MRRLAPEQGNVTIIVSFMLVVLLGAGALALDIGALVVQRGTLTNGADAVALAVARDCALNAVEGTPPCDGSAAADYLEANGSSGASLVGSPSFTGVQLDGRAGTVTVVATTTSAPVFAGVLGVDATSVTTSAAARWAPVIAMDVLSLAICHDDSYPSLGVEETIVAQERDEPPPSSECVNGLAWLSSVSASCTTGVHLLEESGSQFQLRDAWDVPNQCNNEMNDLLDAIADGAGPAERTIHVALYDPSGSLLEFHRLTALVAFEVTGLRLDDAHEETGGTPWDETCPVGQAEGELVCIRGFFRGSVPFSDDITIASDGDLTAPGPRLADSTILSVRLVPPPEETT